MTMSGEQLEHPDPQSAMEERAAQIIAAQNARTNRFMLRFAAPVTAINIGLAAIYLRLEQDIPDPEPPTYSCTGFSDDVLKPPTNDRLGFALTGKTLDPNQLSTDGMTASTKVKLADGSPVKTKPLGSISNRSGVLYGSLEMPSDYARTIIGVFQSDTIRWGICNLDGGVSFVATDTDAMTNGEYRPDEKAAALVFKAGGDDILYDDGRDMAYVQTHEIGHSVRDEILADATDTRSMELIQRLDDLYKQHLSRGLEEYRTQNSDQIVNDLNALLIQFQAIDDTIASQDTKLTLQLAVEYIKEALKRPGGLTELAMGEAEDSRYPGQKSIGLGSLNSMIAKASMATAPESPLYGLDEYIQDYPDLLDRKLLFNTDDQLKNFLEPRFMSENLMPGNSGGHPWDNTDELFASGWTIVGLVSKNHYPEFINSVPEQYRDFVREQLEVMHELRSTIDPDSFTD